MKRYIVLVLLIFALPVLMIPPAENPGTPSNPIEETHFFFAGYEFYYFAYAPPELHMDYRCIFTCEAFDVMIIDAQGKAWTPDAFTGEVQVIRLASGDKVLYVR